MEKIFFSPILFGVQTPIVPMGEEKFKFLSTLLDKSSISIILGRNPKDNL